MHLLPQSQGPTHVFSTLAKNSGISVAKYAAFVSGLVLAFLRGHGRWAARDAIESRTRPDAHVLVLAVAQVFTHAVDLSFFNRRRTHHADTLGDEALDRLRLADHRPVNLEQRQAAEVRVEFPSGFGGVKLGALHGAEISGSAEGKTVAEVLVRRLSDGQHVARRLRHAARVEVGELHARIFHGSHCLRRLI